MLALRNFQCSRAESNLNNQCKWCLTCCGKFYKTLWKSRPTSCYLHESSQRRKHRRVFSQQMERTRASHSERMGLQRPLVSQMCERASCVLRMKNSPRIWLMKGNVIPTIQPHQRKQKFVYSEAPQSWIQEQKPFPKAFSCLKPEGKFQT